MISVERVLYRPLTFWLSQIMDCRINPWNNTRNVSFRRMSNHFAPKCRCLNTTYKCELLFCIGSSVELTSCSNACEGALQNPLAYTESDWEDTMTVNLKTPWLLTRAVARRMKSSGREGSVIFVSYISGIERGLYPGVSVHGSAMAGLHQLTKVRKFAPIMPHMSKDQFFMIFISVCLVSVTIDRNGCI